MVGGGGRVAASCRCATRPPGGRAIPTMACCDVMLRLMLIANGWRGTGNGMTVMRTWMTWCALVGAVVAGAGIGSGTVARAEGTAPVEGVVELRVFPTAVNLLTNRDRQLIVVQAVYSDGLTRDVAGQSQWTLANAALVKRDGNTLYAMADGTCRSRWRRRRKDGRSASSWT